MAVSIDARRAELPLPGGRDGATVSVEPMLCGEVMVPPAFFDREAGPLGRERSLLAPRSRWFWVPIQAFLVRHPGAGVALVDTGLHPSVAIDPKRNLGQINGRALRIRMDHDQALEFQLAARSLTPADVRVVVLTHLHFDHASGVSEFPAATFLVDAVEWRHATHEGLLHGYHQRHFDHAFDWRAIDFEARAVDSFASFGRSVDVFGDGSLRLVSTPGHTFGHMSVLARLHGRELLITADAMYSRRSLTEDLHPLFYEDLHVYRRSLAEIRRYVEQTRNAVVIPGHDPESWPAMAQRFA
jgi:glyoxylase-like metal-dependent hydrolase (beta-lactamase superfamily II)